MTSPSVSPSDSLSRQAQLLSVAESSSSLSTSSPAAVSCTLHHYLNCDLLIYTAGFLSISDLFRCSSICRLLHDVFDSDKCWRQRLAQAEQTEATIQIDDQHSSSTSSSETADSEQVRDSAQQHEQQTAATINFPSSSSSSSSPPAAPSLIQAFLVIDSFCRKPSPLQAHWGNCLVVNIRRAAAASSLSPSSSSCAAVFHVKRLRFHGRGAEEAVVEYRAYELKREQETGDWVVQRIGSKDSGLLVLNSDDNVNTPPPPPPAAAASCKQRYIALLSCSEHTQQRCFTLLPPSPSLPSPPPPPSWFSQNLRDAVAQHAPSPPLPVSAFPAFHPLPLCSACRSLVAAAVGPHLSSRLRGWGHPLQLACLQRVNRSEYDCRLLHYEDQQEHRRCVVRFHFPSRQYRCERLYQADSGVYAIAPDSNVPWQEPAPSTGETLRGWAGHEHPLRRFMRSPYLNNQYVCNECAASESGEVWRCSRCQFDLCLACRQQVETARLQAATAAAAEAAEGRSCP